MKKAFAALVLVIVLLFSLKAAAGAQVTDEELIIRAVASCYPDAEFGTKTAICAVILNRVEAEGFGNSVSAVIRAVGSGFDASLLCEKIEEKNLRITYDACVAALAGADPTNGLLYFEKLPEPEIDDNLVEFEEKMNLEKYRAVIGGYGFW